MLRHLFITPLLDNFFMASKLRAVEAFSSSLFMVSQIVAEPLVDLLYRLASRCE
jgi:hypothetical protein